MKLFLQKNAKFSSAGGLRPQTPIGLRRLGAPPPDPSNSPPIANFWLRAWSQYEPTKLTQVFPSEQMLFTPLLPDS